MMEAFGIFIVALVVFLGWSVTSSKKEPKEHDDRFRITKVEYASGKVTYLVSRKLCDEYSLTYDTCKTEEAARESLAAIRKSIADSVVVSKEEWV